MFNYNIITLFKKNIIIILLPAIVLSGITILLFTTHHGVGICPDSAKYINVAEQILANQNIGFVINGGEILPMIHYPPLYPLTLSSFSFVGINPMQGAKLLNIFILVFIILLVALMIHRFTKSILLSVSGALIILTSSIIRIHSMAWTEPLFIFLGILGLLSLAIYFEKEKKIFLLASSLLFSLAFLTKYSGVAFVGTGFISLFLLQKKKFLNKLYDIFQFSFISCLPILFWIIRNFNKAGTLTGRKYEYHPITFDYFLVGIKTISTWIFPINLSYFACVVIFILFLVLII